MFDLHVGIDYSGRDLPTTRTASIQVYAADHEDAKRVAPPAAATNRTKHWCRREVAGWIIEQTQSHRPMIIGIDHGFSFPISYFSRHNLESWDGFLRHFCHHWKTLTSSVEDSRKKQRAIQDGNSTTEFRLTERWTSSAKSVFLFDVQGSVAKSTHAGLPWLYEIRRRVGERVHFWPFDGFTVPKETTVIAEVYPSIFHRRYPRANRSPDEQDAYAVAKWLAESDRQHRLDHYLRPPLTDDERETAAKEGWILGVT